MARSRGPERTTFWDQYYCSFLIGNIISDIFLFKFVSTSPGHVFVGDTYIDIASSFPADTRSLYAWVQTRQTRWIEPVVSFVDVHSVIR